MTDNLIVAPDARECQDADRARGLLLLQAGAWTSIERPQSRRPSRSDLVVGTPLGHAPGERPVVAFVRVPRYAVTIQALGVSFVTVGAAGSTLGTCLLRR